ncbi:MAG: nucleotide exchange factor GrpE [Desulfomonilaceae bacterium]
MTEWDRNEPKGSEPIDLQEIRRRKEKALEEHARTELTPVSGETSPGKGVEEERQPELDPLEKALKEVEENRDHWMRAAAEFENYKKRALQEKSKFLKYRNEELLRDLLVVVDNLERAQMHCEAAGRSDALADGVCMVTKMFRDILERYGVREIKALGGPFDPHVHEAIARVPAQGEPANQVVEEMEKGYMYQDRLLRPAKVVVSVGAEQ